MGKKELKNAITLEDMEERWQTLPPSDDFIFSKLMRNPEICKGVIEVLLNIKIEHIEYLEEEKTIRIDSDAKSVRLDVYVESPENKVYNIEMQTVHRKDLPKRSRYYQGMVDLNMIEKGACYDELKESYVIFICTFDPFDSGNSVYRFGSTNLDRPDQILGDDAYKYFFNTKGTDDTGRELRELLNIFENVFPESGETPLSGKIREELAGIRANREWRVEYMNLLMRDRENIRTGLEQGVELNMYETAFRMFRKGFETGDISEVTGADEDTVKDWLSGKKKPESLMNGER